MLSVKKIRPFTAKLEASKNYLLFGDLYGNNSVSDKDWLFFTRWAASPQIILVSIHEC